MGGNFASLQRVAPEAVSSVAKQRMLDGPPLAGSRNSSSDCIGSEFIPSRIPVCVLQPVELLAPCVTLKGRKKIDATDLQLAAQPQDPSLRSAEIQFWSTRRVYNPAPA